MSFTPLLKFLKSCHGLFETKRKNGKKKFENYLGWDSIFKCFLTKVNTNAKTLFPSQFFRTKKKKQGSPLLVGTVSIH